MHGVVKDISESRKDKKGNPYHSIRVDAWIPCYSENIPRFLKLGAKYNFILLSKHDFVEITGAKLLEG